MTPTPLTAPQLVAVLKVIASLSREEQVEIGRQAAAMITDLDARLVDACSIVLTDKPMCIACFETEPHTGTCGSSDPRALCNKRPIDSATFEKKAKDFIDSVFQPAKPQQPQEPTDGWPKFLHFATPTKPKDE